MPKTGRPKLDELEKALRKGKRLWIKLREAEELYESDPSGPATPARQGRPPVKHKTVLERVKKQYNDNKKEIRRLAEEKGESIKSIEAKIRETEDPTIGSGIGRPRMIEAQEIEYKIRLKQARIARIKAGEEKERLAGKKTKSGKHLGRYPKSDEEKISRLEDQILAMRAEVRALEAQMSADELEDLAIRRLRRTASMIRAQLREEGLDDLRLEAHKNWEEAKNDGVKFPASVIEAVALERSIDERARKLRDRGYVPK